MTSMYGADTAQLYQLAQQFSAQADRIDHDRMSVGNAIQIQAWAGPIAVAFRHRWESEHSRKLAAAASRLRKAAADLKRNADDQERASAVSGGSGMHESSVARAQRWEREHATDRPGTRNIADFVRMVDGMNDKEDGVRIQKILGDDGIYRYVVYIDGSGSTRDGDWGGRLGWEDNAVALGPGSGNSKTLQAVRGQIRARISDPDAEVALVGFSQGGIIAQQLADEGSFNTKAVLTYGSPPAPVVNNYGGADVLRLVQLGDPVPQAVSTTSVLVGVASQIDDAMGAERTAPGSDVTFLGGAPTWDPHSHDAYTDVAAAFDKSHAPEHVAARNALLRFSGTIVADER